MAKISIQNAFNFNFKFEDNFSKEELVYNWLIGFRDYLIKNKLAEYNDIMPSKKDISKYLKISTGTIQNAFRHAEDKGYFVSKQCIGTMIKNKDEKTPLKMISKKDKAVIEIKKFLYVHKYDENEFIPSLTELAYEIKTSVNTIRLAVNVLIEEGILRKDVYKKNTVLVVNSKVKPMEKEKTLSNEIKSKSLVKIVKENIKKYIVQNCGTNEKIPTNGFFAEMFNVSVRTVNSATRELNKEKFILSRRGNYGSLFLNKSLKDTKSEKSIFMSKAENKNKPALSYGYKWETVLNNIKHYILKNHEAGDKIPSMKEFAQKLHVSVTTVKKAVHELSVQGILYAQKGKYGGLFITEMPQQEDSFTWLAVNPAYFNNKK